jgi:hypothetical protein
LLRFEAKKLMLSGLGRAQIWAPNSSNASSVARSDVEQSSDVHRFHYEYGSQVGRQPLHVQTLTVKWWTSAPEPLRIGRSEYLLHALSGCATNLDLFWQSVVEQMKRYGFYFVDPRQVSIEFRGGGKPTRRRFADN